MPVSDMAQNYVSATENSHLPSSVGDFKRGFHQDHTIFIMCSFVCFHCILANELLVLESTVDTNNTNYLCIYWTQPMYVWFLLIQGDHRSDRSLPGCVSEGGRHGDWGQR